MKFKTLAFLSLFTAMSANASVVYDENGVGFVGKGDIQSLFDWNNSQLQTNAAQLEFRFISAGTATWECEWFTGPTQKRHVQAVTSQAVNSSATVDPRKNNKGMITGFNLNGTVEGEDQEFGIGDCHGIGAGKTLVEDSIKYEGNENPLLQVRFTSEGDWFDLPISQ